jgi:hypothetical protein
VKQSTIKNSIRSTSTNRARVLVLYNSWFLYAETTREHVEMFAAFSAHEVTCADVSVLDFEIDLSQFETIVFHYSLVTSAWHHDLASARRDKIINAAATKMLFIQDEFRWVTSVTDAITELGISVVFTVQPQDTVKAAYQSHPHWKTPMLQDVRFVPTLTGFVDERLVKRDVPDYEKRPLDVTYRARKLPFWVGRAGLEKYEIAARFLKDAEKFKLKCDISTDEAARIYGDAWFDFTTSSKATLGTEGSSGLVDFDGKLIPAVDAYCAKHPNATFEQVEAKFFAGKDGLIKYRAISPRCFEAAALRTLMVMYKGEYSGVLEAGRHYVELKRDHSNIKDVVKILRDPKEAKSYIRRAYDEIACSGKYTSRAFVGNFDKVVSEEMAKNRASGALPGREPFPGFNKLVVVNSNPQPVAVTNDNPHAAHLSNLNAQVLAMLPVQTAALSAVSSQLSHLANAQSQLAALLPSQTEALTRVMQVIASHQPAELVHLNGSAALQETHEPEVAAEMAPLAAVDEPIIVDNVPEPIAPLPELIAVDESGIVESFVVESPPEPEAINGEAHSETTSTDLVVMTESTEMAVETPKIPWTVGRIVRGVGRRVIPTSVRQSVAAKSVHWAGQTDRLKRSYQIFMVPPEKRQSPN